MTGSIASGKSTVGRLLNARGIPVIDADVLARKAADAYTAEICARFPAVCSSGRLNRAALAAIVFADPAARRRLEEIVHPWVRSRMDEELAVLAGMVSRPPLVMLNIPLLFEGGLERDLDGVLVVTSPKELRALRALHRDGLEEAAFLARDLVQVPECEKVRKATWVIENDSSLDALERKVDAWLTHRLHEAG